MKVKTFPFALAFCLIWFFLFFFQPKPISPPRLFIAKTQEETKKEQERAEFEELLRSQRNHLVEEYIRGYVTNEAVLIAMKRVPRHKFMRAKDISLAYENRPQPIGNGQTISQPSLVAYITELLDLKSGDRVLEVGTRSGYQTAVLAELVQEVYSVEQNPIVAKKAEKRLKFFYQNRVQIKCANGIFGWSQKAPFDAILVTLAMKEIPLALLEQLKEGGKMVIPIGGAFKTQELILVTKTKDGIHKEKKMSVRFVSYESKKSK